MKIVRLLAVFVPVLAYAAGDSTEAKRGWLGVYTDELSKPMLVALDIDHGVLVTDVAEGSPAAKAGIETGDVITLLDGQSTTDGSALRWAVRDRPDKNVVIKVHRRGKEKKLDVTLGTREGAEKAFDFEWQAIPQEAFREAKRVLREAGPELKRELERSDLSLDSLRKQMDELRKELNELRRKLTEKQKGE
ncbi:PDZ domain-containing protein [candidate division WOR-3 bacterium]|uniref:PDZ domain-containing protein n=1 Tax=candidate division WOR-3 bacterium TaxID=2052148 RepID=A0A938BS91_UNCW3|nr:PDZ domain-containing protein [candidate division WOR-3 bacterium]